MSLIYDYCKEAGICPICGRKAEKGKVCCPYHTQKRREAARNYYARAKEREKADPEFHRHRKEKRAQGRIRYRAKCKAENRCYACGKPATHGVFCTRHWRENVEKGAVHPYENLSKPRPKLRVPQVSDKVKTDVGKLIALYNAGWSYKHIELEMKISSATIGKYVKMARDMEVT